MGSGRRASAPGFENSYVLDIAPQVGIRETRRVLGVHVFGTAATELVHLGQTVMAADLPVDYLVDAVFNYPTFSEAYKVAALDVMNKLRALNQFRG